MTWFEVGDRVFVRRHPSLDLNIGLVIGDVGCLVVDTRASEVEGRELAESVRRVTAEPWSVVNTHAHFDHCFGNRAFLPAPVWGHGRCAAALREGGERTRGRIAGLYRADGQEDVAREIEATVIHPPDRWVDDVATLALGGRQVELRHLGRGHTDNDLVVLVPDCGVVLAGDLVEEGAPPQFGDAYPLDWPATLDALLSLVRGAVVPGHGAVVDATYVSGQREELVQLTAVARRGHAEGRPVREVAADLPGLGEFALQAVERTYWQLGPVG